MKHVKHCLFAAITALLLMVAFGGSAFAHTITVNPGNQPAGHTYTAYKIFTGNYDSETSKIEVTEWSDVDFGKSVVTNLLAQKNDFKSEAVKTKLNTEGTKPEADGSPSSAKLVANAIDSINDDTADAKLFAKIVKDSITAEHPQAISLTPNNDGSYSATGQETGYYLIVDNGQTSQNVQGDFVSDLILRVAGSDVNVSAKGNVPSVQKKVNTASDAKGNWQDAADYNIGDTVPFQLTGTLPSNFEQYTNYKYVFTDTCSPGLTPNLESVKVYVKSGNDRKEINKDNYILPDNLDNNSFTVTFNDLKAEGLQSYNISADSEIIVEYNATLNSNAVIGTSSTDAGNPNTVKLTYSNNPTGEGTGDTPPDVVYVFTYELDVTKVNQDNHDEKVSGAEFVLSSASQNNQYAKVTYDSTKGVYKISGWESTQTTNTKMTSNAQGKINIIGLDAGTYTLTETKAPNNYVTPTGEKAKTRFTILADLKETLQAEETTADKAISNLKINESTDNSKASGIVSLMITNAREGALPSTGSMGMFIMIGVGICLMAGAGIYLLKNRNKA